MKAVHFGAGNIGRGFIGHMLSASEYEVCFVARNARQIELLQKRQAYPITLANETQDTTIVSNVTAINISDGERVSDEIAAADLITTAVGVSALRDIARPIAEGITLRMQQPTPKPLHIIACENAINGSSRLKNKVYPLLDEATRKKADQFVAFPNAAVDRIVPAQKHLDPLQVTVEPFFEWVVQRSALLEGFHTIQGVRYVESLEPYIERKLFTVNTGHCCAAYLGHLVGMKTIRQVMHHPALRAKVRQVMEETGKLLIHKYDLDPLKHAKYIDAIMKRFANPNLTDKVTRVGRSPLRKLSPHDRLVRPALLASEAGIETPGLVSAIGAALVYYDEQDSEAVSMQQQIAQDGISSFISSHMGIPEHHTLHIQLLEWYASLQESQITRAMMT